MIINKIEPQGYCSGVKLALSKAYQVLEDKSYPRPIYLLGSIIHNKNVIADLTNKGAILIEEQGVSRDKLLDQIPEGTVIFSAHGVSPIVYQKAKEKGLTIVDTTCGNVILIHKRIQEYLAKGYTCLYIGTKGHPECEGVLGISSSIHLIEKLEDIEPRLYDAKPIYVTNQTTLSLYETDAFYKRIQEYYPKAILDNSICHATTIRQKACMEQPPVDLCIVVGDVKSSNTKKLVQASETAGIRTIQIETEDDVSTIDFTSIQKVSITSGASTPEAIVNKIIEKIKRVNSF